jgi:hypothetical protein
VSTTYLHLHFAGDTIIPCLSPGDEVCLKLPLLCRTTAVQIQHINFSAAAVETALLSVQMPHTPRHFWQQSPDFIIKLLVQS